MFAKLSYTEASSYIKDKYKKEVRIKAIDDCSAEFSLDLGKLIPTIKLTLKIDSIANDEVNMSYSCGVATSALIAGAEGTFHNIIPKGITLNASTKTININLSEIEQLKKTLEIIELKAVLFKEEDIEVEMALKQG